jgi:hypothetical protein
MGSLIEDERSAAASRLSRAAKEAMREWKKKTGVKTIVPKTKNQRLEMKNRNRSARTRESYEMRKISHGAASRVRTIKPPVD